MMKRLSDRERQVLQAIADGAEPRKVAEDLCLSPHTVKHHLRNSYLALGARGMTHAVVEAARHGMIDLRIERQWR
jgi:DNA-binding NarL/FixJ family response regulator